MSYFKIYSSSAGSGKTFTLTKNFLVLILKEKDPYYFKKVLAITFTNDAAAEMKKRVMDSLQDFGVNNSPMFQQVLAEIPELNEKELRLKSQKTFKLILQNYSDLAIKTIDSFFNQIVQSFTLELNLPYNYQIELKDQQILRQAIERLFDKVGKEGEEKLTEIISEYALVLFEEDKSLSMIMEELLKSAKKLNSESDFFLIKEDFDLESTDFFTIRNQIKEYLDKTSNEIKDLGNKAKELITNAGLTPKSFTNGQGGIGGFYDKCINNHKLFDAAIGVRVYDAINDDKWFKAKDPDNNHLAFDPIKPSIIQITKKIIELIIDNQFKYNFLSKINKSIPKSALFQQIIKEQELVLEEQNKAYLSDLNKKILQEVSTQYVPYIYERIGEKYNHILIDEFQDTSSIQFLNFLPLLENNIAEENLSLIVGDPKQAIYKWRGGKMELMIDLINKEEEKISQDSLFKDTQKTQLSLLINNSTKETLNKNHRSRKEIIEFNNKFFKQLKEQESTPLVDHIFEDYYQECTENTKNNAHVSYHTKDQYLEFLLENIKEAQANGYGLDHMAILSRRTKETKEVATFLRENGISIKSSDSLVYGYSQPVNCLVAFLSVINEPTNLFNKVFAYILFYQVKHNSYPNIDEVLPLFKKDIQSFFDVINTFGYDYTYNLKPYLSTYHLAEELAATFDLYQQTHDFEFLNGFLDIIHNYSQTESLLLNDFINFYNAEKFSISLSSQNQQNSITITTIHKAKGLEFPIVFFLAKGQDIKTFEGWMSIKDYDYPELFLPNNKRLNSAFINYSNKLGVNSPPQHKFFEEENIKNNIESYNLIYVALTRAVDRLIIVDQENKLKNKGGTIIEKLIKKMTGEDSESILINEGSWESPKKDTNNKDTLRFALPNTYAVSPLKKIKTVVDLLEKKNLGNIIHDAFALIDTEADIDFALDSLENKGVILSHEKADIRAKITATINLPELKSYFTTTTIGFNEKDILQKGNSLYRPDRIILEGNEAIVLDYKTGTESDGHKSQIRKYGKLLNEMGYSATKLYLVYLESNKVVKVG